MEFRGIYKLHVFLNVRRRAHMLSVLLTFHRYTKPFKITKRNSKSLTSL